MDRDIKLNWRIRLNQGYGLKVMRDLAKSFPTEYLRPLARGLKRRKLTGTIYQHYPSYLIKSVFLKERFTRCQQNKTIMVSRLHKTHTPFNLVKVLNIIAQTGNIEILKPLLKDLGGSEKRCEAAYQYIEKAMPELVNERSINV